jgi:hypothetical protein
MSRSSTADQYRLGREAPEWGLDIGVGAAVVTRQTRGPTDKKPKGELSLASPQN